MDFILVKALKSDLKKQNNNKKKTSTFQAEFEEQLSHKPTWTEPNTPHFSTCSCDH